MAHVQRRRVKGGYRYRVRYLDDTGAERNKTFRLKGDADTFLTSVSHQLLAGTYIDPAAGRVTLKAQAERWRKDLVHLRASSASSLERNFRLHVYPTLGDRPISAIRPSDIAAWQRALLTPQGPLSARTVKQIRGHLSAMFSAAIVDRVLASNPITGIRAPKPVKAEIVPLTPEQVLELAALLPLRYRAVVTLVAGSGLRASEVFGLTVDRIDFLRKTVRVDRQLTGRLPTGEPVFGPPKTVKSERTVPVAEVTLIGLSEHLRRFPPRHGLVFTASQGGPVSSGAFGPAWRPAAKAIGMKPKDGLHQIRHFYASVLIDAGRSVKEVQARLGHTSAVETLDTYAHLWPTNDEGTRAAIEAVFRPSQAVRDAARPS